MKNAATLLATIAITAIASVSVSASPLALVQKGAVDILARRASTTHKATSTHKTTSTHKSSTKKVASSSHKTTSSTHKTSSTSTSKSTITSKATASITKTGSAPGPVTSDPTCTNSDPYSNDNCNYPDNGNVATYINSVSMNADALPTSYVTDTPISPLAGYSWATGTWYDGTDMYDPYCFGPPSYTVGGVKRQPNANTDFVAAVVLPGNYAHCYDFVEIATLDKAGNKLNNVTVQIVDYCQDLTCANNFWFDMSTVAFNMLKPVSVGEADFVWKRSSRPTADTPTVINGQLTYGQVPYLFPDQNY